MNNYLESLKDAIKRLHGCEASHIKSEAICEMFNGKVVWDGVVEIYALLDHPTARQCYAWSFEEDSGETRFVAVLHAPPVDSAVKAVRAYIINNAQQKA